MRKLAIENMTDERNKKKLAYGTAQSTLASFRSLIKLSAEISRLCVLCKISSHSSRTMIYT